MSRTPLIPLETSGKYIAVKAELSFYYNQEKNLSFLFPGDAGTIFLNGETYVARKGMCRVYVKPHVSSQAYILEGFGLEDILNQFREKSLLSIDDIAHVEWLGHSN